MDHRATGRVLDIFELLAGQENGMNLTDICDVLGAPKSSLFPILHTLEERGYLKQERQTRCYRIGQMAYQIGNSYLRDSSGLDELEKLIGEVHKQMKKAAAELNFEAAATLRDQMISLKKYLQEMD